MARTPFGKERAHPEVRPAGPEDIVSIVELRRKNRATLRDCNAIFWKQHAEADGRFAEWMSRSLTFTDRDMLVHASSGDVRGYLIASRRALCISPQRTIPRQPVSSTTFAIWTPAISRVWRTRDQGRLRCWLRERRRLQGGAKRPRSSCARPNGVQSGNCWRRRATARQSPGTSSCAQGANLNDICGQAVSCSPFSPVMTSLRLAKNCEASFFDVESIRREPICASLPPTWAVTS